MIVRQARPSECDHVLPFLEKDPLNNNWLIGIFRGNAIPDGNIILVEDSELLALVLIPAKGTSSFVISEHKRKEILHLLLEHISKDSALRKDFQIAAISSDLWEEARDLWKGFTGKELILH